jgi:hypothetical protein
MWMKVTKIQVVVIVALILIAFSSPFIYRMRIGSQNLESTLPPPPPPAESSQAAIKRGLATAMSASVSEEVRSVAVKADAVIDVESAIEKTLNDASPADGIAQILMELQKQSAENVAASAVLYHTMGMLYLRAEPPDISQADAAFGDAVKKADSAELRQQLALSSAKAWLEQDDKTRARKIVTDSLQMDKEMTAAYLRMWLLIGSLEEMEGRGKSAEEAYAYVVDLFPAVCPEIGKHSEDVYRRACQMLYSFYDRNKRNGEAEMLHMTMRETLVKMEQAPSTLAKSESGEAEGQSPHAPPTLNDAVTK